MMLHGRRGATSALAISAVLVVVVILIATYAYTFSSKSSSSSSMSLITTSASTTSAVTAAAATTITANSSVGGPLVTYSADAYAPEVTSLLTGFANSTGATVAPLKSGGSFADAAEIAAGAPDDVFISVALSATSSQYLKNLTSNWAVGFASDQMVLAYSNATEPSSAVTSVVTLAQTAEKTNATSDWNAFYGALTSGTVKVGISNPVSDPAGLRGWLVLEAAGYLYSGGNPQGEEQQQAYVTPLLQSKDNVTGTNAAALVSPLEAGQIQFLFIYKSAAVADGLNYLVLDSHVNFGNAGLGSFYSKFSYTDSAGAAAGSPIILCVTVPLNSVNTGEALQFVQYVVENAKKTLPSYGLTPLTTALLYSNVSPPAPIQALVSQGLIVQAGALPPVVRPT
jgi:molybdate/tungstate transport system substrate-binding protein